MNQNIDERGVGSVGGPADNAAPIPFARPSIGREEEEAVLRVLRSGWLTTGAECSAFEKEFATMTGAKHCLAVNSATSGLHLALLASGLKAGDAVVTTPLTFAATAEVICAIGAKPVFADIDPRTANIDPQEAEQKIRESGAKALIPVHMGGLTCPMAELREIAQRNNCVLIEDAAHSLPAQQNGTYAGCFGDIGVYSFYANKTITSGEGGMLVTERDDIAQRVRRLRMHGIDRDVWQRFTDQKASWQYDVTEAGYKYNLPDVLAAIGRVQLQKAHTFRDKRAAIAQVYLDELAEADFLELPPQAEKHSWHLFQIRLLLDRLSISRNEFIHRLQQEGIGVSVHYIPLHTMTYYQRHWDYKESDFPHTMDWYSRCISLPIYPDLTRNQQKRIIDTVLRIGKNA